MSKFVLLFIVALAKFTAYQQAREFFQGLATGYESSEYVFPRDKCFNDAVQTALNDKLLAIGTFASLNDWDMVRQLASEFLETLKRALAGCEVFNVWDSTVDSLKTTPLIAWPLRLFFNYILIFRYCDNFIKGLWQTGMNESGFKLGSCLHYMLPRIA